MFALPGSGCSSKNIPTAGAQADHADSLALAGRMGSILHPGCSLPLNLSHGD